MNSLLGGLIIWSNSITSCLKGLSSKVGHTSEGQQPVKNNESKANENSSDQCWGCCIGLSYLLLMPLFFLFLMLPCFFIPILNLCLESKLEPDMIPLSDLLWEVISLLEHYKQIWLIFIDFLWGWLNYNVLSYLLSDISFSYILTIMSYSFLLKYIIIGDSGTSYFMKALANPVCSFNTLTKDTDRNTKSPLELSLVQKCWKSNKTMSSCKYGIQ